MGVLTRAEKRRATQIDRISSLPDGILGDIVSLLPTKDGARTQVLSSLWRHLWCSAPLNLNFSDDEIIRRGDIHASDIPRILSAHPGPGRRFIMSYYHGYPTTTTLEGWLRSPALDNLQELRFYHYLQLPLPPSVHRFSSTLRVASFRGCSFPDENNGGVPLLLPVLESLTLDEVTISESCLHGLLAGCLVLQSLVLIDNRSFPRLQIVSPSLRSIRVGTYCRGLLPPEVELVIKDVPCLEKLECSDKMQMNISVVSAPRLAILGETLWQRS